MFRCKYQANGCQESFDTKPRRTSHHGWCRFRTSRNASAVAGFDVRSIPRPVPKTTQVKVHRYAAYEAEITKKASQDQAIGYEKTSLLRPFALNDTVRNLAVKEALSAAIDCCNDKQAEVNQKGQEGCVLDPDKQFQNNETSLLDEDDMETDTSGYEAALLLSEWSIFKDKLPHVDGFGASYPVLDCSSIDDIEVALIDLLFILQHHKTDLSLFDDVLQWANHFSRKRDKIFSHIPHRIKPTRHSVINRLRIMCGRKSMVPRLIQVESPYTKKVYSVPVFPMKETLVHMLTDPSVMHPSNYQTVNFDPVSFRPIRKPPGLLPPEYNTTAPVNDHNRVYISEQMQGEFVLDDLYTGTMIHHGIHEHCPNVTPEGYDLVRPLPICLFIDETHTDNAGRLKTTPIPMCLGFHNIEYRRKLESQRLVAVLPPFDVNDSRYHGAYDEGLHDSGKSRRGKGDAPKEKSSVTKLRDYQLVLGEVFKELISIAQEGGISVKYEGKQILYKIFLLLNIGDAKGNNMLCCSYNTLSNQGMKCFSYYCTVSFSDLANHTPNCRPLTRAMHNSVVTNPSLGPEFSQHPINVAMNKLPIAEEPHSRQGIAGVSPCESLHVLQQGLYKEGCLVVHNLMGRGKKNAAHKDYFHMLLTRICLCLPRNSDRDFPPAPPPSKSINLSLLTGKESEGTFFSYALALCTKQGMTLFKPHCEAHHISVRMVARTMFLLLAFDRWSQSRGTPVTEVGRARPAVSLLMQMLVKYLPNPRYKKMKNKKKNQVPDKKCINTQKLGQDSHIVLPTAEQIRDSLIDVTFSIPNPNGGRRVVKWFRGRVTTFDETSREAAIDFFASEGYKQETYKMLLSEDKWMGNRTSINSWKLVPATGGGIKRPEPAQKRSRTTKAKAGEIAKTARIAEDDIGVFVEHDSAGSNGWHKYKFHQLYHILDWMIKFGPGTGYSGESGEEHHKDLSKYTGKNTQRRVDHFADQVSTRIDEKFVIDTCHRTVQHLCPRRDRFNRVTPRQYYNNTPAHQIGNFSESSNIEVVGKYTLVFKKAQGRHANRPIERNVDYIVYFQDPRKNMENVMDLFQIDESLIHALSGMSISECFSDQLHITGYTEARFRSKSGLGSTIYHCTPNLRGKTWYDWAFIEWPDTLLDDGEVAGSQCIGRIHGFVRFETLHFPTHKRKKVDLLSDRELRDNIHPDNTLYVVIGTNKEWISMSDLARKFVIPFRMQEGSSGMYIMPANVIVGPVTVLKDYSQDKDTRFLAVLPKRGWPEYFRHFINDCCDGSNDRAKPTEEEENDGFEVDLELPDIEFSNDSDIDAEVDDDEVVDDSFILVEV